MGCESRLTTFRTGSRCNDRFGLRVVTVSAFNSCPGHAEIEAIGTSCKCTSVR
jgi:hypothetical protein